MNIHILCFVALLPFACPQLPAASLAGSGNLSGRWEIDATFDDPSLSGGGFDCGFEQQGDRLTGSCQQIPLTGEVKGTDVTWRIKAGQTQDTITYTGTMNESGTSINGRFSMPGKGGRFTASKQ
jgi:hypothetical protein